jgi:uncharacterized protein YbjT (DUF2867 family)
MIVVTGATGELGRAVAENLLRYVPAARVAAPLATSASDEIQ